MLLANRVDILLLKQSVLPYPLAAATPPKSKPGRLAYQIGSGHGDCAP